MHPWMDYTEVSISQQYYWPNLREKIRIQIKVYRNYHKNKQNKKYDHLISKEAEGIQWDILLVDLTGPWKLEDKVRLTISY